MRSESNSRREAVAPGYVNFLLPIIDLHQDLYSHVAAREVFGSEFQTSFALLTASPVQLVVASVYNMHANSRQISAENSAYYLQLMAEYRRICSGENFHQVLSASDLQAPGVLILVHVEGFQVFTEPIEDLLEYWYQCGVRSIGPMWNLDNGIGGGPDRPDEPLSANGRRAIRWIDRHPLLLDLAHMGRKTFWDTVELSSGPLLCSHGNARGLQEHPRNLDDQQLQAIAERQGVIGLVFSKRFLGGSEDLQMVIRHADYIAELIGPEYLALGSDFGGLRDLATGLESVANFPELSAALVEHFGPQIAADICANNARRVITASLSK